MATEKNSFAMVSAWAGHFGNFVSGVSAMIGVASASLGYLQGISWTDLATLAFFNLFAAAWLAAAAFVIYMSKDDYWKKSLFFIILAAFALLLMATNLNYVAQKSPHIALSKNISKDLNCDSVCPQTYFPRVPEIYKQTPNIGIPIDDVKSANKVYFEAYANGFVIWIQPLNKIIRFDLEGRKLSAIITLT